MAIRNNMDPDGSRSDAELNEILGLVHSDPSASAGLREKFKLDREVLPEGHNCSAGEKQLRKCYYLTPSSC